MSQLTHCIVGATSTIAKSLIKVIQEQGDNLHLVARNLAKLEQYSNFANISAAVANVTNLNQLKEAINACPGSMRSLIYFPGTLALKNLQSVSEQEFFEHLKINTTSALFAAQYSLEKLQTAQGTIVFISSVAAKKGFANHSIISTCKAGIEGLTVALAKELAPAIRVNCVAPSLIDTKLTKHITSNQAMCEAIANSHPLKRIGKPEDVAKLINFLVSEKSSWITGQIYPVDGGRSTLD